MELFSFLPDLAASSQFPADILAFLFVTALVAGLLDTLAGGGGLIVVPALMMSGVPPLAALGTNKLQGSVGTATSSLMMLRKKRVQWPEIKPLMVAAFAGSVGGTIVVQFIDTDALAFVIPVVLLMIAVYFLISPTPVASSEARVSAANYRRYIVPGIGCYDGMFGPGTGSFFTLAGVSCKGLEMIAATAMAKPLNFATNIASLMVFLLAGHVVWSIGLLMMLGQAIGAWCGAHCLVRINPAWLRGIVVIMSLGMLLKYASSMGGIG